MRGRGGKESSRVRRSGGVSKDATRERAMTICLEAPRRWWGRRVSCVEVGSEGNAGGAGVVEKTDNVNVGAFGVDCGDFPKPPEGVGCTVPEVGALGEKGLGESRVEFVEGH